MAYKVVWSTRAKSELADVFEYLEKFWSQSETKKLAAEIERIIGLITKNPFLFPAIERRGYRRVVVLRLNYLVYQIERDEVKIVAFYPTRKKPLE